MHYSAIRRDTHVACGSFALKAAKVVRLYTSAALPKADVTHNATSSAAPSFQFGRTSILLPRPPHLPHLTRLLNDGTPVSAG